MEGIVQDIRYAVRMLLKSPGFTLVAVISLALGIGANTTIFTVVNAVLLNPLPVEDSSSLVQINTTDESNPSFAGFNLPVSFPNFEDIRDQSDVFEAVFTTGFPQLTLSGDNREPAQVNGFLVTANFFDALGVRPVKGRGFLPDEDKHKGGDTVVVLSYALWQREFGADPSIIGKQIILNSMPFEVIGVAPSGFKGMFTIGNPDLVWIPTSMYEMAMPPNLSQFFENRRALFTLPYARLKSGVSMEQAEAAVQTIGSRLSEAYQDSNKGRNFKLTSLREAALGFPPGQGALVTILMMSVVGLVLLIACVNLANLLLARGAAREKEMSIRAALGAGRSQLVRQLLTESIVLSIVGGAAGLLVAFWAKDVLWAFRPPFLNENAIQLNLDPVVLLFTMGLAVLTGLLFGVVPAIKTSDPDLNSTLRIGGRTNSSGIGGNKLRAGLVVVEVALAMVALIGAGLFVRSMQRAQEIDTGWESEKLFVMSFDLGSRQYEPERGQLFFDDAIREASAVPGVEAAAISSNNPMTGTFQQSVFPEGKSPAAGDEAILVNTNRATPSYFKTMTIPLLQGRLFNDFDREGSELVVVVNEAMAARFWPGEDPLGKRFFFFSEDGQFRRVIGMVRNSVVTQIGEDPQMQVYLPMRQNYTPTGVLHVRTAGAPESVLSTVRTKVQALDRNLALTNENTIQALIGQGLWAARMGAALLSLFGLLALALAAIGVYGVLAYNVNQRRQEIGIRLALGAQPSDVLRMVVGQGMMLTLIGSVIGVALAYLLSLQVSTLLYGVSAADPVAFLGVPMILALVAFVACYIPARRATHVDPVIALRFE